MNSAPLQRDYLVSLQTLNEVIRRSIDGTVPPLFVDYANQRVLIGSTTASGSAKLQIVGNVTVNGTVTGTAFSGNGAQLTGVSGTDSTARLLAVLMDNF